MSRVVHFEIHASEPARLIAFYRSLFGWKIEQWGEFPYWQITTGEASEPGINGGLLPRRGAAPSVGQAVDAFVCTVQVASVDEAFAQALALGGAVAVPKMPIPGVGWLAYVRDPDGNILGLMCPDTKAR